MRPTVIVLCLALLLGGCTPFRVEAPSEEPVVKVEGVKAGGLPSELMLTGEVRASRRATVDPVGSGVVERVGPEQGDRVAQGEPVVWLVNRSLESQIREAQAQVDAARSTVRQQQANVTITQREVENQLLQARQSVKQAEIAVKQAKTELDSARNDLDRKTQLFQEKAIAETQVEQARLKWEVGQDQLATAQSKLEAARADLKLAGGGQARVELQRSQLEGALADLRRAEAALQAARVGMEETVLRAPLSGVVISRSVEPGQSVGPGQGALLTLVDSSEVMVQASVDQRYASALEPGMTATLTTLGQARRDWQVRLRDVVPSSDPQTNTVTVRFTFPGAPPQGMVDGTTVQLRLLLGETRGVLLPRQAVQTSSRGDYAWVVEDGTVSRRPVRPLARNEAHILVSEEEFKPGDLLVVEAGDNLRAGQTVQVRYTD